MCMFLSHSSIDMPVDQFIIKTIPVTQGPGKWLMFCFSNQSIALDVVRFSKPDTMILPLLCLIRKNTHIQSLRNYPCKSCKYTETRAVSVKGVQKSQGRVQHCVRQRENEQSETVIQQQRALLLCKAAVTWLWSVLLLWHVGAALLAFSHSHVEIPPN